MHSLHVNVQLASKEMWFDQTEEYNCEIGIIVLVLYIYAGSNVTGVTIVCI